MGFIRRLALLASVSRVFSAFYILRSCRKISVERVTITSDQIPPAFSGFRIALLADFHGRVLDSGAPGFSEITAFAPNMVCLGGDYVNSHPREVEPLRPMLRALSHLAPTYAVSGNHDHLAGWPEISVTLAECGVQVLSNRSILIEKDGAKLWLSGVDDPASGYDDLASALPPEQSGPIMCLVHSPSWFLHNRNPLPKQVFLVLAGHTHGGQIKLPLIGAVTNATGMLFPRRLVEGLSREGHTWLYINRGLGYTKIPIRFMSPAEITLITLNRTESDL
ncbi:MAG TPA: metallophosphoesterase [Bacillota bacterium]|nr:metallophosphoesterase [Bacillota bacterium]